jgi:hypothetical protein
MDLLASSRPRERASRGEYASHQRGRRGKQRGRALAEETADSGVLTQETEANNEEWEVNGRGTIRSSAGQKDKTRVKPSLQLGLR